MANPLRATVDDVQYKMESYRINGSGMIALMRLERQVHADPMDRVKDAEIRVRIVDVGAEAGGLVLETGSEANTLLVRGIRITSPDRQDIHERVLPTNL